MLTQTFLVIGDGLFWRRAVDPTFDGSKLVPAVLRVIAGLLKPVPAPTTEPAAVSSEQNGSVP
jgi:hypothetical protein